MKSSRNTSTSGKPASGRRTPARKTKAKKKTTRTMPVWMRNTLALIVVGVFSLTFYYFVIRPYSYRWKECYGRKEYGVCIPCGYEVHGIDISHYQGNIDWNRTFASMRQLPDSCVFIMEYQTGTDLEKLAEGRDMLLAALG